MEQNRSRLQLGARGADRAIAWLLPAGLALAFAFKTLGTIHASSLWEDELASAIKSFRSLGWIFNYLRTDVHPPFYYLILHFSGKLFGATTIVLRGFSWIAYILSAAVLAWTCWLWNRSSAASLSAGLIALSLPFTVRYAVEGKGYALLVLLLCLAIQQRMRVLNHESGAAIPCSLLWSAAALTHYYGMGLLLAQIVLDGWRRLPAWRPLAWALVLPTFWMLWTLPFLLGTGGREWITPAGPWLLKNLAELSLGPRWPMVLLLIGLLMLAMARPSRSTNPDGQLRALVTAWGLDAGLLLLLGSFLISMVRPSAFARYYIVLVPATVGVLCSWLGDQLSADRTKAWKRWLFCGVMATLLCLFWRDAYLIIRPSGIWAGSRTWADYRTLAQVAAPEHVKFALHNQCSRLRAYDLLLGEDNMVRPEATWQCLPKSPPIAASSQSPIEAAPPSLLLAATWQPLRQTSPLQDLQPFLNQLQGEGYQCVNDAQATHMAQLIRCTRDSAKDPAGRPASDP